MKNIFRLLLIITLVGCQSASTNQSSNQIEPDSEKSLEKPIVDPKYSLTEDRQKIEELRKQIPEDKRAENDELAFILNFFANNPEPSKARDKYQKAVRKRRDLFDKDLKKEREQFTKTERKNRDAFLKQQKEDREIFLKRKPSQDDRKDFFSDQDEKRKTYFADERDKRQDFESDFRERRKNFEDYIKSKNDEFNQEHRNYIKQIEEQKRLQREQKKLEQEQKKQQGQSYNSNQIQQGASAALGAGVPAQSGANVVPNNALEELNQGLQKASQTPGSKIGSGE